MNSSASLPRRFSMRWLPLLAACAAVPGSAQDLQDFKIGAAAWSQYGTIFKSTNTSTERDLNGRTLQSYGAQLSMGARLSEKLTGAAGIGVFVGNTLPSASTRYAPQYTGPYIAEANFTYTFWNGLTESGKFSALSLRGGYFPYDYHPDVKNLGLYLLRGPVYPGVLISGFETKHTLPVANQLGFQLHHQYADFEHDVLVNSETEFAPFYDISVAYIANYRVGSVLRVGAGVNFYHLIPVDEDVTSGSVWGQNGANTMASDSSVAFDGTKLMANASFDPKPLFGGSSLLGAEDLKLYGEVALIGLDNDSVHKALYGDYMHRMPVMVGFNLPVFKVLDHLSLEVEWYGAAFPDNLSGYNHTSGRPPTPLPNSDPGGDSNLTRDNWKWSLHGSRRIGQHVQLSFQLANDHFRPGIYTGDGDNNPPGQNAVLSTPKDWYGMLKLAYFF